MGERVFKSTTFPDFLKHTDEKEKSALALAQIWDLYFRERKACPREPIQILDIGAGTGLLTQLVIQHLGELSSPLQLSLLEPDTLYVQELRRRNFEPATTNIINDTWENHPLVQKFDIVVASHLYHLKRGEYGKSLLKMLHSLKPDGLLLFIFRNEDDVFKFKEIMRPEVGLSFEGKSAQEFLQFFALQAGFQITDLTTDVESTLTFPEEINEVISIIEFLLSISWPHLTTDQQMKIFDYLASCNRIMTTSEKIIAVRFAPNSESGTLIE